ncbi:hypothetical protein [Lysinibacillus sp. GbtcB16]|uniref:hypothetical protein n=1 Tax=Lysinibacillus sp. GbtcB16 TaxID=2824761 RepID=UPI001C302964|nr:hypothetical protein [Lysinibacillus sp. GbtcB16]
MIKSNLKSALFYNIVFYLIIVAIIFFFKTKLFWKYSLVMLIFLVLMVVFSYLISPQIKLMILDEPKFFTVLLGEALVLLMYLVISIFSCITSFLLIQIIWKINLFNPSDSFWGKLSMLFAIEDIGYMYFLIQSIWIIISFIVYSIALRIFNAISTLRNDGFNFNDQILVKPLLKHCTVFVGLIAVIAVGTVFIQQDNYVYDKETETLYKVVEINYDIKRIEKLTTQEKEIFENSYEGDKTNPIFPLFIFSVFFLIPYVHLIYKSK